MAGSSTVPLQAVPKTRRVVKANLAHRLLLWGRLPVAQSRIIGVCALIEIKGSAGIGGLG
jgi:hypothetical protein